MKQFTYAELFNEIRKKLKSHKGVLKNFFDISFDNDKMLTKTSLNDIETLTKLAENGVSVTINNYEKCIIVDEKTKPLFEQGIATARKIKNFDAVEQKDFYNVLIKMKEVKDSDRIVKDKAVCDEILPNKSVSAEIIDYEAKELINKNPFDNYYLVDLSVNRIDGVIKLYRIHTLHKIIPKEDLKEENERRKMTSATPIASEYDEDIVDVLNTIKRNIDSKVYDRNDILKKDAYFEQTVMKEITDSMNSMNFSNSREDRSFIQFRVSREYLDQYNSYYMYD